MVLPWYSNNVASINHMFWYTEVFYTILPDTFSPFFLESKTTTKIFAPCGGIPWIIYPKYQYLGTIWPQKAGKVPPSSQGEKSLGGRLQPAVTFIDILCLLDYMQMKWDQIWFLVHYRTIWTITTPKKFIFCQHEQKRNNGRFNIIGTACFYKFSVALCIFLVCRCRWPDCLQE